MNFTSSIKFVCVCASLCLLAALAPAQDSTPITTAKTPYVRTGNEATLAGTVNLIGKRPKRLLIDSSPDPVCGENIRTEWFEGEKGRLANVVVYVKSEALEGLTFEPPAAAVTLEHRNCSYVPHVVAMQAGQRLMMLNADLTHHNTHPIPKHNREWNLTQMQGSAPLVKVFELPELAIPFKDNQHPWEKAYLSIFSHPFFAVTDRNGNFKIEGLPPGAYTLISWHERLGEKTTEVVLLPGETKDLSFAFEAPE